LGRLLAGELFNPKLQQSPANARQEGITILLRLKFCGLLFGSSGCKTPQQRRLHPCLPSKACPESLLQSRLLPLRKPTKSCLSYRRGERPESRLPVYGLLGLKAEKALA